MTRSALLSSPVRPALRGLCAALAAGLVLLAVPTEATAQSARVGDEAGEVIRDYERAAGQWGPTLSRIARNLFASLAAIEIALSAILWYFRRESLNEFLGKFVLKFGILSFLFAMIGTFEVWLPPIVNGFMDAGQAAGGVSSLEPGQIAVRGSELFQATYDRYQPSIFSFSTVAAGLMGLVLMLTFFYISVLVAVALVESIIVLSAGVLFLGFAAFRATARITEGYIEYAFRVGVRLFMLYLLVGVGRVLSQEWVQTIRTASGGTDLTPLLQVAAGGAVFAIIVHKIPKEAASIVTGGLRLGIREGVAQN